MGNLLQQDFNQRIEYTDGYQTLAVCLEDHVQHTWLRSLQLTFPMLQQCVRDITTIQGWHVGVQIRGLQVFPIALAQNLA